MNADQMEIPLPAPVLHALTEEAKKFGLSCEEYLKKIVIGIMKDELEKKKFLLFLDAKKHADRNERTILENMALCRCAGEQYGDPEREHSGNLFTPPFP